MLVEDLKEPISVRADFSGGVVTPRAFKMGAQTHAITKVNARWEDRKMRAKRYHFSVEAAGNIYELHLDSRDMSWQLDRVCLEG